MLPYVHACRSFLTKCLPLMQIDSSLASRVNVYRSVRMGYFGAVVSVNDNAGSVR